MQPSLRKVEGHSSDIICAQVAETPVLLDSLEQRVVVEIGVVRAVDHYTHGAERNQSRIHLVAGSARVFVEDDDHQCAAADGVSGEGAGHPRVQELACVSDADVVPVVALVGHCKYKQFMATVSSYSK